jgi:DtxR family transcriptional regulator, Mn-dependent transcriptional regulator
MSDEITITPSLENYIEVLYELNGQDTQVRVTDLAKRLSIAKSSVNQAITLLVKLGFALHEKYGRIELTEKGVAYASDLQKRHHVLQTFFADILHVDGKIANNDACIIEHVISPATMQKLTEYLQSQEQISPEAQTQECTAMQIVTLDKLRPGIRAKVLKIAAKGAIRQRIMDMGITSGSEIVVEKVAPMGDPIEVTIKGYALALRGAEANGVIVQIVP